MVRPKPWNVLKNPQAWLLEIGDVILYPTFYGYCINPYFALKSKITHWVDGRVAHWEQNGWSAIALVERGRAFGFLNWYRVVTTPEAVKEGPSIGDLGCERIWRLARPESTGFAAIDLPLMAGRCPSFGGTSRAMMLDIVAEWASIGKRRSRNSQEPQATHY